MLRQPLSFAVFSVLALAGCPSSPAPAAYAVADWQVRCDSTMLGCTPLPSRLVTGMSGESGNSVSCSTTETGTDRLVNFRVGSAAGGVNYSIGVTNARVPRAGGSPAAGCSVTVTDGANTFEGPCSGSAPTDAMPCQVTLDFDVDIDTGSPRVTASIFCDHLPNTVDPTIRRAVFRGAGSTLPASVEIYDCRGLSGT